MDGLQWYPRYVGDYARKTKHLTMLEHGAYNLLLDHYYATGKPLLFSNATSNAELMPDHSRLYRLCSAITKQEQDAVDSVLKMFFEMTDEGYENRKASETITTQQAAHLRRVNAGRAGGKQSSSNARAKPKQPEPEPEPINPPNPPQGGGVGLDSNEIKNYSIERKLTPAAENHAKRNAPGWEMQELYSVYNTNIRTGKMKPPTAPAQAFPAWCLKYTKGNKP